MIDIVWRKEFHSGNHSKSLRMGRELCLFNHMNCRPVSNIDNLCLCEGSWWRNALTFHVASAVQLLNRMTDLLKIVSRCDIFNLTKFGNNAFLLHSLHVIYLSLNFSKKTFSIVLDANVRSKCHSWKVFVSSSILLHEASYIYRKNSLRDRFSEKEQLFCRISHWFIAIESGLNYLNWIHIAINTPHRTNISNEFLVLCDIMNSTIEQQKNKNVVV